MTATVAQAAAGLKTNLETISGLRVFDYIPDKISAPMCFVSWERSTFHRAAQHGLVEYEFSVVVVVSGRASERTAQAEIYGYVSDEGTNSIRAAIESDRTLSGIGSDLVVTQASDLTPLEVEGAVYLTVAFDVTVFA